MALPLPNPALVLRLRRNGIVNPIYTIQEAKRAGLALDIACAMLFRESAGGHNVWGHDEVPRGFPIGGNVTESSYRTYKRLRVEHGNRHMQGCGPTQLTYYTFQDRADKYGGCQKPRYNLRVGFETLAGLIHAHGLHAGVAAYNGSGAAAQNYADAVISSSKRWAVIIKGTATAPAHPVVKTANGVQLVRLNRAFCFNGKEILVALKFVDRMEAWLHRHPHLKAYSGYRTANAATRSDHKCGFALDIVPDSTNEIGKQRTEAALEDARRIGCPYVEPIVWTATNKHGHASFGRCG